MSKLQPPIKTYVLDTTERLAKDQTYVLPNGDTLIHPDNEQRFRKLCELAHYTPMKVEPSKGEKP